MKCILPRRAKKLSEEQQKMLEKEMTEAAIQCVRNEEAEMQIRWNKMEVLALHQAFGFGKKRIMRVLIAWRHIYKKIVMRRFDGRNEEEFNEWLDSEVYKIVDKQEFDDFIKRMRETKVVVKEKKEMEENV